jgi:hypothetical protein
VVLLTFNSTRRCAVMAMRQNEMVHLEGGGLPPYTVCGIAVGATFGAFFFNPLLGLYLSSKAIGICAIEAAL